MKKIMTRITLIANWLLYTKLVMKYYQNVFFAIFLIISLIIRLFYIDFSSLSSTYSEISRDYIVADHLISYGEIPLRGHSNFFLRHIGLQTSPVYYYILAIFLIPHNDRMTLAIVNIFLQVATLVLIYLITKAFFDYKSAILAVILFGFIPFVLNQSENIWQPWVMQTVALLALYLLSQAFLKKNYTLLIAAVVSLVLALSIHFSAVSWLPLFILSSFVILRLERKKIVHYIGILLTLLLALFILHFPVLLYLLGNGFQADPRPIYSQSINYYFNSVISYFRAFNLNADIVLILIVGLVGYLILEKRKRWLMLIGLILCLSTILAASFFERPIYKYQLRFITLSFSIFAITISVLVNFYIYKVIRLVLFILRTIPLSGRNILTISLWLIVAFVLFKIFSQDFSFLTRIGRNDNKMKDIETAVLYVESKVLGIKQKEKIKDLNFFQIVSFTNRRTSTNRMEGHALEDAFLLMPLEKKLNRKLAITSRIDLSQTNKDDYIFLVCYDTFKCSKSVDCTIDFLTTYKNYFMIERIFSRPTMSIFLFKKLII